MKTCGIPAAPYGKLLLGSWNQEKSLRDPLKGAGVRASNRRRCRLTRKQSRASRWARDANERRDVLERRGVDCLLFDVLVLPQRPRKPFFNFEPSELLAKAPSIPKITISEAPSRWNKSYRLLKLIILWLAWTVSEPFNANPSTLWSEGGGGRGVRTNVPPLPC